mgnify:FL=1
MGRRNRKGRDITGIFLLDKPSGITSNKALQVVKYLFQAKKAGHTGSLDPLATGVLPICLGEATKVSSYLLDSDKEYFVTCRLGIKTDTADIDGEIIKEKPVPETDEKILSDVIVRFTGDIKQIPPMYSALKKDGKKLCDLARKGIEIERAARPVTIKKIDGMSREGDNLSFTVSCSKGTYVRSLVEDIAEFIGTVAHVTVLRRIGAGGFSITDLYTLEQLREQHEQGGFDAIDKYLLPADHVIQDWPYLNLNAEMSKGFVNGLSVPMPPFTLEGLVRVYDENREFIGIGEKDRNGDIKPKRVIQKSE